MNPEVQEKQHSSLTRTLTGTKVMSFSLKTPCTTYKQLLNKMLFNQLGKTMEIYIDNML